ncbi:major facilitator superfamily domain-containing protein 6-like [Montipora capricornis]|uniref:major facilitator superfamily domain-containing protein 6-like n=1 Tax=Montipora capricornis TaxID=246305 RepID=UPI0035F1C114
MSDQDEGSPLHRPLNKNEGSPERSREKSLGDWIREELRVDKTLLLYKGFYFLFFAGFGASFPYMALYFKQIGLNASSVGMLAGIRPIIQFISGPFWAVLADKYRARKAVLLFSILSWLVMTVALLLPKPQKTYCRNLMASNNQSDIPLFTRRHLIQSNIHLQGDNKPLKSAITIDHEHKSTVRNGKATVSFIGNSPLRTKILQNYRPATAFEVSNSQKYQLVYDKEEILHVYIYLMILVVAGEFLEAPTFIMADTGLLQKLGEKGRHYGKTRLFGSLGFAFASFVVGGLLDTTEYRFCGRVMNNYNVLFYTFAIIMAIAFIFAAWMFEFTYDEDSHGQNNGSTKEILTLLVKFQYAYFLIISFFLGFSNGLFFNFLNWYLEDLGGSKSLMGIATMFRAAALILAYIFNACLAELFGHVNLMLISVAAYFILFGSFSIIQNPWWALPLEFLEGLTYGTTWSTAVTHLADATPKGGAATMQGILQGVYWGLGGGLGAILGGVLIDAYGAVPSFRLGALMSVVALVASGIIQYCISFYSHDTSKIEKQAVEHAMQ